MKIVKKRIYGKEAQAKMMEGVDELANVVGSTMSARGRNVVVDKGYGSPLVINDGVSVANEIFFNDDLMNLSAQLIKDAANMTNMHAGDGTSGTIVLARSILKKGWEVIEKHDINPVTLRKELEVARDKVEEKLKSLACKVESVKQAVDIARVSVQDKELGQKIGELMFDVGANGAVAIKNSVERGVFIEKVVGMRLEGQQVGGIVENKEKWEAKFDKPRVLVLKDSIEDHEFETKWVPFLKQLAEGHRLPNGDMQIDKVNVSTLIVVAEKLSRRFIMAMNANLNTVKWCWFRPTTADKNMKEIYQDLQALVGGLIVEEENGVNLQKFHIDNLGKAETATATRHELVLTIADSDNESDSSKFLPRLLDRINVVKGQIENAEDEVEKRQIKERLANLTKGVAMIKVAAATEQDTTELKLRIEDAINATRSAMEEGYVSGGGVALLNCIDEPETKGEEVLYEALKAPISQIFHNAGYEGIDKMISRLKEGEGIDVLTDNVANMIEIGIIDPLKVIRFSMINAVSVAGLLLTSEYVITDEDEDDVTTLRKIFTRKD